MTNRPFNQATLPKVEGEETSAHKAKERTKQCLLLVLTPPPQSSRSQACLTYITVGARDNGTTSKQPITFEQTLIAEFTNSKRGDLASTNLVSYNTWYHALRKPSRNNFHSIKYLSYSKSLFNCMIGLFFIIFLLVFHVISVFIQLSFSGNIYVTVYWLPIVLHGLARENMKQP